MSSTRWLRFHGPLGKFTWRMLATVLAAQGVAVFLGALVARGLARAEGVGHDATLLWVGIGLAVLCLLAAGLMRRPFGLALGWLIQLATLTTAVVLPEMLLVGVLFLSLWLLFLWKGSEVDHEIAERDRAAPGQ